MDKFKPGDVVRLKSGSPRLTVVHTEGVQITVAWIAYGQSVPHNETYPEDCLYLEKRRTDNV